MQLWTQLEHQQIFKIEKVNLLDLAAMRHTAAAPAQLILAIKTNIQSLHQDFQHILADLAALGRLADLVVAQHILIQAALVAEFRDKDIPEAMQLILHLTVVAVVVVLAELVVMEHLIQLAALAA